MKINEIFEFKNFYEEIKDRKLPLKVAYKLNKLLNKLNDEIKFYQEEFSKIVQEYGERDKEGNFVYVDKERASIKIIEGKKEECDKKIIELNNFSFDLDGITFTLDELESLDLTITEMGCLMPFIVID